MLGPIFHNKAPCSINGFKRPYPRINGRNGKFDEKSKGR